MLTHWALINSDGAWVSRKLWYHKATCHYLLQRSRINNVFNDVRATVMLTVTASEICKSWTRTHRHICHGPFFCNWYIIIPIQSVLFKKVGYFLLLRTTIECKMPYVIVWHMSSHNCFILTVSRELHDKRLWMNEKRQLTCIIRYVVMFIYIYIYSFTTQKYFNLYCILFISSQHNK